MNIMNTMKRCEIAERTTALFKELKKYPANSKEYREIESEIVKINLRIVGYVANKFFPFVKSTLVKEDLVSEGYVALVKAVRTFDSEKQIAFSTYANRCIRNTMIGFLRREPNDKKVFSLEAKTKMSDDEDKLLDEALISPINIEKDFIEKDEADRRMAWVRNNLDHLAPREKQVIISRYLSGETTVKIVALAKEFGCTKQNIFAADINAINKLKRMYFKAHPEEIELTNEEKIKLREGLKDLIENELTPMQKKTMLCKFYTPTQKTNGQVAEEIGSTRPNVTAHVSRSYKKLCTICDSIKDTKHLKNILEFRTAESGKEC